MNSNKSVTANFTQTTLGRIIDNRDPQTALVGSWPASGGLNPYGTDSVYARNPDLSFSWLFTPSESGTYEVSMWWTEFSSRSSAAPVEIQHASGTASMTVNQLTNGGIWNVLGQYSFNAGTTYRVTIRTLTDNSSISADAVQFVKTKASETYTLTTTATNGTIVKSPDKTAYTAGETVTLTATANPGYTFTGWSGDAGGTAASVTITMNSNKSVTAAFTQNVYTLTTAALNGTVTKSPDKPTYTYGETVTLTATSSIGYSFDSWTGSVTETTNPVAITMDNNKSVTANFIPLPTALGIRDGLVGEWMFSENTGPVTWDSSLNANCAFLSDENMWKQPGNLYFESPQTYLTCPPAESLNLTGSLTISAWINPRSYGQSNYGRIVDKGDGAGNRGFSLMVNGTGQNFGYLTYGGDYVSSNDNVISLNTWTHICAAYDEQKKTITFFVNGQEAGTSSYARSPAATDNDPLYIGLRGYDRLRNFDGIIDGVCLYSRSLNITEVQQLYAAGKEGRLVGLWLMDDYRGSEASDRSGYDNTAILQNNPEWGFGWAGEDFIKLNGTNQAALIDCTALQTQTGTIAMLVQPETSEGLQFLFGHTLANTNYIYLYTVTGKLALGLGNSTATASDIAVLEPGVMYHIALTWNGTIYAVYVDGKQKAAGVFSGLTAIAPVADIANMGTPEYREQNMGLNGIIDDVQIFSQALSAKEIDALSKTWRTKQNRSFAFCVSENIPDNPASYTAANLPAGAAFDVTTQTLTWTPWYNQAGDHQIIFVPQDQSDPLKVIVSVHNVKLKDWYQEFLLRAGKL